MGRRGGGGEDFLYMRARANYSSVVRPSVGDITDVYDIIVANSYATIKLT